VEDKPDKMTTNSDSYR